MKPILGDPALSYLRCCSAAVASSSSVAQSKDFLPLTQAAPVLIAILALASPTKPGDTALFYRGTSHGALDAAAITCSVPGTTVAVLDAAHRVVRINVAQLNLGKDDASEPGKYLVDAFSIQRAGFRDHRDALCAGPSRGFRARNLPAVRRVCGFLHRAGADGPGADGPGADGPGVVSASCCGLGVGGRV